ncbi:MAG: hypothetical protein JWN70_3176 [Planctomycetaceae bacterium]|nr:hypothetical protein [Planctomycetaceae bacterium]
MIFTQAPPDDDLSVRDERMRVLVQFWNNVRMSEDSGATTWEVLERLEMTVTDALSQVPPAIKLAERLTAEACLLMTGFDSC